MANKTAKKISKTKHRLAALQQYQVEPGTKANLKQRNPADRSARGELRDDGLAVRFNALQNRLADLQDRFYAARSHRLLLILQGMDTSGKDGTIRHVFGAVDPIGVDVHSYKAPNSYEKDRDFLWRHHRDVPGLGEIAIHNRSHYEAVLIERVHRWIKPDEVGARFRQIEQFERMLAETGTVIVKCFLHISKDEQRRRLEARRDDPEKNWKFNVGDLEERKLWNDYMRAYEDALTATSSKWAPWYVIAADSKTNRNIAVSELLIETLDGLQLKLPPAAPNLNTLVIN
jgi:PPK2 family polyphosphate:nucleotide phosphotransferase